MIGAYLLIRRYVRFGATIAGRRLNRSNSVFWRHVALPLAREFQVSQPLKSKTLRLIILITFGWFVVIPAINDYMEEKVEVTNAWSLPIRIPVGKMVGVYPRTDIMYEVKVLPSGNIYTYGSPEPGKNSPDRIAENFNSFQIRIRDKVVEKATFDYRFREYKAP